jgi:hypothetical protein
MLLPLDSSFTAWEHYLVKASVSSYLRLGLLTRIPKRDYIIHPDSDRNTVPFRHPCQENGTCNQEFRTTSIHRIFIQLREAFSIENVVAHGPSSSTSYAGYCRARIRCPYLHGNSLEIAGLAVSLQCIGTGN